MGMFKSVIAVAPKSKVKVAGKQPSKAVVSVLIVEELTATEFETSEFS